jgi:hypothetical protein
MVALGVAGLLARPSHHGPATARRPVNCIANLEKLGRALDRYAAEHDHHWPARLNDLLPGYLDELPVCPLDGLEHFSDGYRPDSLTCQKCREQALRRAAPMFWRYLAGSGAVVLIEVTPEGRERKLQMLETPNNQDLDGRRQTI